MSSSSSSSSSADSAALLTEFAGACAPTHDGAPPPPAAVVKVLSKRERELVAHGPSALAPMLAAAPDAPAAARLLLHAYFARSIDDALLAVSVRALLDHADAANIAAVPIKCACGPPALRAPRARPTPPALTSAAAPSPPTPHPLPRAGLVTLVRAFHVAFLRLQPGAEAQLVAPLQRVMAAVDVSSLTPLQPLFLGVCLAARAYDAARPVAAAPIYDADHARETNLTPAEAQQHFVSAGAVFAHLREWARAAEAFRLCMLVPAEALSVLALEAHRRWLLASVVATGIVPQLPRAVSGAVARGVEKNSGTLVFLKLAKACCSTGALDQVAVARAELDGVSQGLWGAKVPGVDSMLVEELHVSVIRRRVLRLSKTYTTASIAEVAAAIGTGTAAAAAADLVDKLVAEGHMVGVRVDRAAGMLTFVADAAGATGAAGAAGAAGYRAAGAAGRQVQGAR